MGGSSKKKRGSSSAAKADRPGALRKRDDDLRRASLRRLGALALGALLLLGALAFGLEEIFAALAAARAALVAPWRRYVAAPEAEFRFGGPNDPALVLDPSDGDVQYVLMPLRV